MSVSYDDQFSTIDYIATTHSDFTVTYSSKQFLVPNGKIATEPFPNLSISKETKGGFAYIKNKNSLIKLKVVFKSKLPNLTLSETDEVFVRADTITMPWSKEEYEIEGKKFILIPFEHVQLIRENSY